jgi:hypothetical protein
MIAMIWPTIAWLIVKLVNLGTYIVRKIRYEAKKKQQVVVVYPNGHTDYVGEL